MSDSKNQLQALSQMNANVNVGMDEVVNVFVTQYEDSLYAKRNEIQDQLNVLKTDLKQLLNAVTNVDTEQYVTSVPVLNLISSVESVNAVFEGSRDHKGPHIVINVRIGAKNPNMFDDHIDQRFVQKIVSSDVKRHTSLNDELKLLNADLMKVMSDIKGINRKERQIRGKISAQKLEQSGFADLLESSEMLQLIQVD